MALADWNSDMRQREGEPDDLGREELAQIERALKIAALAGAETERLSSFYESVAIRVSAAEQKIESLTATAERSAGSANDRG